MKTAANPQRYVTVRALRPFLMHGEVMAVGDELKVDFVDARYLESAHKAKIVPAQPETEVEPAAEQLSAKEGFA